MTAADRARILRRVLEDIEDAMVEPVEVDMDEIQRLAAEEPLPADRARSLYTRIWKIIHPELTDEEAAAAIEPYVTRIERPR
jgi:hypothetical protein